MAMTENEREKIIVQARELFQALRDHTRHKWDRDLPLEELIFDRWERAQSLGFGPGTSVYHNSYIYGDVRVGEQTWIGPFTLLDGTGGLTIGSYCSISAGVQIYTHDTVAWATSGGVAQYVYAATVIGSRCFIGAGTIITKGVTIGDGCVIGANSLVLHDIPQNSKAFGSPCRIVGPASP